MIPRRLLITRTGKLWAFGIGWEGWRVFGHLGPLYVSLWLRWPS